MLHRGFAIKELSENMLGYSITHQSRDACIQYITNSIESKKQTVYLACANPHSIEIANKDTLFAEALKSADLLVPDGAGIVLASKILGGKIRERITGSDIFTGLNERLNKESGYSCFFLGSTEKNLALIKDKVKRGFPNIEISGAYSPPFKSEFSDEDNEAILKAVNKVKPDVLWVGMTAPKQEKWIYQNKAKLDVSFIGAIGAVFDFYAGTVKRSNIWFQQHGLEWLPRLLREPRRLWYRNLISTPKFMMRVILQRLAGNSSTKRSQQTKIDNEL